MEGPHTSVALKAKTRRSPTHRISLHLGALTENNGALSVYTSTNYIRLTTIEKTTDYKIITNLRVAPRLWVLDNKLG